MARLETITARWVAGKPLPTTQQNARSSPRRNPAKSALKKGEASEHIETSIL
jgi:hypothetical protein